ncbi:DUF7110 family protein [Natronocalculus amylovorans]|uniref:Uncharacterized protein n=1 Tax=Natronocalculus amylovorans TaxID=2917812 RepID=A0AAE3K9V0_9EURY|nr:hypothetical protein [Natronocalculus amylovorans]MCL9818441.1 hypothetical protein [Natronocalculus amylovorans]NUE02534.1 hypothetical protein [Halorubraceae archaeon YAN]
MTGRVFRLHSTLELPLEDVETYFDTNPNLPPEIEDVDITRRNNTLIIKAVSTDDNLSKYTPTAQLKASVTETRVYEEEPPRAGGPQWVQDEEEEIPSELVEFACFKGDRETVLQNSALQYPMFLVLRDLAMETEKGNLTAITEEGGSLTATRIVEGEERPATVEVVESPRQNKQENSGVNWRDNKFIS